MTDDTVDEFELFRTRSLMGGRDVENKRRRGRSNTSPRRPAGERPRSRCRDEGDDNDNNNGDLDLDPDNPAGERATDSPALSSARARRQRYRKSNAPMYHEDGYGDTCTDDQPDQRYTYHDDVFNGNGHAHNGSDVNTTATTLEVNGSDPRLFRTYSDKRAAARGTSPGRQLQNDQNGGNGEGAYEDNAHHKRTQSMPIKRRRGRGGQLPLHQRLLEPTEEAASFDGIEVPGGRGAVEICRVRSFSTKSGEIVNRGDSFKLRNSPRHVHQTGSAGRLRQKSTSNDSDLGAKPLAERNNKHHAANSSGTPGRQLPVIPTVFVTSGDSSTERHCDDEDARFQQRNYGQQQRDEEESEHLLQLRTTNAKPQQQQQQQQDARAAYCHVVILGAAEVGKTALRQQLMTSEYLANSDIHDLDEDTEKGVLVVLDDLETEVKIDEESVPDAEWQVDGDVTYDAYVVVYSVTDFKSFDMAKMCLQRLRRAAVDSSPLILVANKQDLVRNRIVPEKDGKKLAKAFKAKYTEVSAILNHRVDELLVGTIRQIRLRRSGVTADVSDSGSDTVSGKRTPGGERASLGCFQRLLLFFFPKKKDTGNCDDLLSP